MARQDIQSLVRGKKTIPRDKSSPSVKPPSPAKTVDAALKALSVTMLAMDDAKEAQGAASSTPVAHEAHLVLIPQPSTHPRDPLVCDAVL